MEIKELLQNAKVDIDNALSLLDYYNQPVLILPHINTGKPRSLREEQSDFALAVSHLIQSAYSMGYEITLGDAYRDPRVHGNLGVKVSYSSANSKHKTRLAVDLNLFKNGAYLAATKDYEPLGEWWLKAYPNKSSWGGKWDDGNHFSWLEK